MFTPLLLRSLVLAGACSVLATGQESTSIQLEQGGASTSALATTAFLEIPLHGQCDAAPGSVLMAQRLGYKVGMDAQGFELIPDRGADAEQNAPFAWHTVALRRGSYVHAPSAVPRFEAATWNVAIDHHAWSEHWELRPEGLAQSWTLPRPLTGTGDLVLEGRVHTALRCAPRGFEHAGLEFLDEAGNPVLHYGEAQAFDACGASIAVPASWDGESIQLIVDGAWLDTATYPVLIDPLSAPVSFGVSSTARPLGSVSVALERESANGSMCIGFTRIWSASDHDVYAFTCDADLQNPVLIYSDLATSRSDMNVGVAHAPGADRWIISHRSDASDPQFGATSSLRVVFVDRGATTNNTGVVQVLASPSFVAAYTEPALGGGGDTGTNINVPLVFQSDLTTTRANTPNSEVLVAWIDAAARTIATPITVSATAVGNRYDREKPAVTRSLASNSIDWVVAWQELDRNAISDDWDIRGARFNNSTQRRSEAELADGGGTRHATNARIDGIQGVHCIAWGASNSYAQANVASVRSKVFQWRTGAQEVPTPLGPVRTVLDAIPFAEPWTLGEICVDAHTYSHWALGVLQPVADRVLGYRQTARILRLGGTGMPTENHEFLSLPSENVIAPALTFHSQRKEFTVISGSSSNGGDLRASVLSYPSDMGKISLGGGCHGVPMVNSAALAGNRNFYIGFGGFTGGLDGLLLLSLGTSDLALDGLGFSGCTLKVDFGAGFIAALPFRTENQFTFAAQVALPDVPIFRGDVYFQALIFTPNIPGSPSLYVSDGYQLKVR